MFAESSSHRPLEFRSVFLIYFLLAVIAMVWDWTSHQQPWHSLTHYQSLPWWSWLLATLAVVIYHAISWQLSRFVSWAKALEHLFIRLLSPISYLQIFLVSLTSAFVEEWFFRGVLVTHFGVIASAIAFGLCHFIPAPRLWAWSLWTLMAGLVLGSLYEQTQNLWICVWIHFLINAGGLWMINLKALRSPRYP